jgi:hypothetical protein
VKTPDASPLDVYRFRFLRQRLKFRKAITILGLWKVLKEEWSKVTPATCKNVMNSWKNGFV